MKTIAVTGGMPTLLNDFLHTDAIELCIKSVLCSHYPIVVTEVRRKADGWWVYLEHVTLCTPPMSVLSQPVKRTAIEKLENLGRLSWYGEPLLFDDDDTVRQVEQAARDGDAEKVKMLAQLIVGYSFIQATMRALSRPQEQPKKMTRPG